MSPVELTRGLCLIQKGNGHKCITEGCVMRKHVNVYQQIRRRKEKKNVLVQHHNRGVWWILYLDLKAKA